MGHYANSLSKRLRGMVPQEKLTLKPNPAIERLVGVAIIRGDKVWGNSATWKSHYQLRQIMNEDGNGDRREPGDIEGFVTNTGRFLTRAEAQPVAVEAGQLPSLTGRELLSSDLSW